MGDWWGWAGSAASFEATPDHEIEAALAAFQQRTLNMSPSQSQADSWSEEVGILKEVFAECREDGNDLTNWRIVLEYELPMEGGRRPDVVILAGGTVVVVEFKSTVALQQAYVDQTAAYARDLAEYHEASHGRPVVPILVLARTSGIALDSDDVVVASPNELAFYLLEASSEGSIDVKAWLEAVYVPLPTLVAAARRIFKNEPLPHVRRALSAGIPEAITLVGDIFRQTEATGGRVLVLVAGVPGSGKTLVGLRLVYEQSMGTQATFLSGNGPLVEVLQDALKSTVFVRDLHKFIKSYGIQGRTPAEHVVVFDEAQRAWDKAYMELKRGIDRSEPTLMVDAGERIEDWCALVGLVGDGQEIHSGEEGGLAQWATSIAASDNPSSWTIHCPPRFADTFAGLDVISHAELDLTVSLRSQRAERLHDWVSDLLQGSLPLAARRAVQVHAESYPLYLTRDLDEARAYVRARYEGDADARYGLLASSHAKTLARFGVPNGFIPTSRTNEARWYNDPPESDKSCCALVQPLTEFGCQGLELDFPIVCWGEDYAWTDTEWKLTPVRRKYHQEDPKQLLRNAYRVLLTRGRDGLIIFIPPEESLDATETALLAAGVRPVPDLASLAAGQVGSSTA